MHDIGIDASLVGRDVIRDLIVRACHFVGILYDVASLLVPMLRVACVSLG